MAECGEIVSEIEKYIDDELSDERKREIEEHIKACPACREELEFAKAIRTAISGIEPLPVPEDFNRRVIEAIGNTPPERKKTGFAGLLGRRSMSAVAACLVIAAVLSLSEKNNLVDNVDIGADKEIAVQYKNTVISGVAEIADDELADMPEEQAVSEKTHKAVSAKKTSEKKESPEPVYDVAPEETEQLAEEAREDENPQRAERTSEPAEAQYGSAYAAESTAYADEGAVAVYSVGDEEIAEPAAKSVGRASGGGAAVYSAKPRTIYAVLVDKAYTAEVEKTAAEFGTETDGVYRMTAENYGLFAKSVAESGFVCDLPEPETAEILFSITEK